MYLAGGQASRPGSGCCLADGSGMFFYGVDFSGWVNSGMLRCTDQRAQYRKLGNVMCVLTAAGNLEEHVNQAMESCRMFPEV